MGCVQKVWEVVYLDDWRGIFLRVSDNPECNISGIAVALLLWAPNSGTSMAGIGVIIR